MRGLSGHEILALMECGDGRAPVERALLMLLAALPESSWSELALLPVGRRDKLLMELRNRTVGRRIRAYAECPQCGERLELDLSSDVLDTGSELIPAELIEVGEMRWNVRAATSRDVIDALVEGSDAEGALLNRCVEEVDGGGTMPSGLAPDLRERLARAIADIDPAAEIELVMECPACGNSWTLLFDVGTFLWEELAARARRLMREVHALARAYGWNEEEILAISDHRRAQYLELIG
jgi:hypothetical protein